MPATAATAPSAAIPCLRFGFIAISVVGAGHVRPLPGR
jgi:hypothetical protein